MSHLRSKYLPVVTPGKLRFVLLGLLLSGCSTTQPQQTPPAVTKITPIPVQTIDAQCRQHAMAIENQANISGASAQYLAAANALISCTDGLHFSRKSPERQQAMQLNAVSTLNFIKGGDVVKARAMIEKFKRRYPRQDLYFADYTSFLDTSTALLSSESLTAPQLAALNISRRLRDEIERKHYWLSH